MMALEELLNLFSSSTDMEDDVIENDSIFFFDTPYSDLESDSLLDSLFGPNVRTPHLLSLVTGLFSSLVSLLLRTLLQLLVLAGAKLLFSWMVVHMDKKHRYSSDFTYPQVLLLTQKPSLLNPPFFPGSP